MLWSSYGLQHQLPTIQFFRLTADEKFVEQIHLLPHSQPMGKYFSKKGQLIKFCSCGEKYPTIINCRIYNELPKCVEKLKSSVKTINQVINLAPSVVEKVISYSNRRKYNSRKIKKKFLEKIWKIFRKDFQKAILSQSIDDIILVRTDLESEHL